jgi:hypothetical protein
MRSKIISIHISAKNGHKVVVNNFKITMNVITLPVYFYGSLFQDILLGWSLLRGW